MHPLSCERVLPHSAGDPLEEDRAATAAVKGKYYIKPVQSVKSNRHAQLLNSLRCDDYAAAALPITRNQTPRAAIDCTKLGGCVRTWQEFALNRATAGLFAPCVTGITLIASRLTYIRFTRK